MKQKDLKYLKRKIFALKEFLLKKNLKYRCSEILLKKFLTPHERRELAKKMIEFGITVRKAKDTVEMPLSTLYYHSIKAEQDQALLDMIREVALKYIFYGYRRIHFVMNKYGIHTNHKRVYRIYKSLGLQRQKPSKNKNMFCNHVWAIDFPRRRKTH